MGRSPCCEKVGLKKGPWTPEEDQKLLAYIEEHGHGSWRALPAKAGLQRCGKSCRLRWTNYLRPDIKRGKFSLQEEQTIIQLHALLGNRWSAIATHLPKRTDNEIKNYWNTHLKKRLAKMGIDPVTHKPKSDALGPAATEGGGSGHSKSAANLSHMAQWESARLEAEARLVRESKLRVPPPAASLYPQPPLSVPPPNGKPPCLEVLRAWQGIWSKQTTGGIDMESPTSTSSFSESLPPIDATTANALVGDNSTPMLSSELEGEEVEWKCFGKAMRFPGNNSMDSAAGLFNGEGASWLMEPPVFGTGVSGASDNFAAGFTGMLLGGNSEDPNSDEGLCDSDNADGGSCVEEGEEENKNYWSSILDLVNSSPSNSPPVF